MNKKQVETIVLSEFFDFMMKEGEFSVKEEHQKLIDEEMSKFSILSEAEEEEVEADTAAGGFGDVQDVDPKDIIPGGPPPLPPEAGGEDPSAWEPQDTKPAPPAQRTGLGGMFDKLRGLGKIDATDARNTDQVTAGVVNKIGQHKASLMKTFMNFMYATGAWDNPNNARNFTQQVQRHPGEVPDLMLYNITTPHMRRVFADLDQLHRKMDIEDMFVHTLRSIADEDARGGGDGKPPKSTDPKELDKDDQSGGTDVTPAPDEKEGAKVPKETPLSITKRQTATKPGEKSAAETPLNSYIQKKLGLSAKSANKLAKNIGASLKAKGRKERLPIEIAERKIVDIYALIMQENKALTLEDLIDEKWESVGAQAEKEGGTKPYHQKLKRANDRLAMLKDKLAAATSPGEKSKVERAIRTVDARKDNLLRNMGRVKGEKVTSKEDKIKATREAEKKGAKFGMIGKIIYKYAARQGEKDPEFMEKFGDDPVKQSQMIKKIRKMLRRQLRRRGYETSVIDKLMKESFDIAIKTIMPPLIEHIKKQKLL